MMPRHLRPLLLVLLLAAQAALGAESLTIGVLAMRGKAEMAQKWQPLADYLGRWLPGYRFKLQVGTFDELDAAIARRQVDFVFSNAGHYVMMRERNALSYPLATLIEREGKQPLPVAGGAILVSADRSDITRLGDLRGKTVAISDIGAFGSFQAQAYELHKNGLSIPGDVNLIKVGLPIDRPVLALLEGKADAAFARMGLVNDMAQEGKIDLSRIKVLNAKKLTGHAYEYSTTLYPLWPFVAMPQVEDYLASRVAAALLMLPHDGEVARATQSWGFSVAANYEPVEELMRALRFPPFDEVPEFSLLDVWRRYTVAASIALAASALILMLVFWLTVERKRVLQSEERFRTVADYTYDWEYWQGAQGELLYISPSCMRITGYAKADFASNPNLMYEIIHPEDRDSMLAHVHNIAHEHEGTLDFRIVRKDGATRWIAHGCRGVFGRDGHFMGRRANNRDVTEHKQAEQALVHEKALFETIFNGIPDAIVYADVNRRIIAINPGFTSTFGYAIADLAGKETAFFYESQAEYERQGRLRFNLTATERALPYEVNYRKQDGSVFPGETLGTAIKSPSGSVLGFIGVIRDITERKRDERLLALEHAIAHALAVETDAVLGLKAVMKAICTAKNWERSTFWRADEASGVMRFETSWDSPGLNLEGYTERSRHVVFAPGAGLVGRVWQSGQPIWAADFSNDPRVVQHALAREIGVRGVFVLPVTSEGRTIGALAFFSREVREPDERLLAVAQVIGSELGQFLQRKQAEDQVLKLNADLEQRVKERTQALEVANKELESFSYSVSHDLRAPLRAIQGFSSLVEKQYASQIDEQGRDMLRRVGAGALKMGALIDDLLKLSQISRQAMHVVSIDLTALAWEVAGELQVAAPERKVEWVIAPQVSANGDPGLLRVVLQNLMGNAWKYSAKREGARIEFGACERAGRPAYFVRDNGAGFDSAYADKLFGAFQRLHSPGEFSGTGIGLATVKRIILRHSGEVGAESKVGEGATFYFSL